jgi:hypothetical protein
VYGAFLSPAVISMTEKPACQRRLGSRIVDLDLQWHYKVNTYITMRKIGVQAGRLLRQG